MEPAVSPRPGSAPKPRGSNGEHTMGPRDVKLRANEELIRRDGENDEAHFRGGDEDVNAQENADGG